MRRYNTNHEPGIRNNGSWVHLSTVSQAGDLELLYVVYTWILGESDKIKLRVFCCFYMLIIVKSSGMRGDTVGSGYNEV